MGTSHGARADITYAYSGQARAAGQRLNCKKLEPPQLGGRTAVCSAKSCACSVARSGTGALDCPGVCARPHATSAAK